MLCREQPDLAIKLLTALGRELSVRIRYANMTIQQLETSAGPTSRKPSAITAIPNCCCGSEQPGHSSCSS